MKIQRNVSVKRKIPGALQRAIHISPRTVDGASSINNRPCIR